MRSSLWIVLQKNRKPAQSKSHIGFTSMLNSPSSALNWFNGLMYNLCLILDIVHTVSICSGRSSSCSHGNCHEILIAPSVVVEHSYTTAHAKPLRLLTKVVSTQWCDIFLINLFISLFHRLPAGSTDPWELIWHWLQLQHEPDCHGSGQR